MRTRLSPGSRRSFCHGAAARSVSIKLSRLPPRGTPLRTPTGRPRICALSLAPLPLPLLMAARRPFSAIAAIILGGRVARTASRMTSSSGCIASPLLCSPGSESSGIASGSAAGNCVARGTSTKRIARIRSSSFTSSRSSKTAAALAARRVRIEPLADATPSDVAAEAMALRCSSATRQS